MSLTVAEQQAKLLGMTVKDYLELLQKPQSEFDELLKAQGLSEGKLAGLETAFGNDLKETLNKLQDLTAKQAKATRDSNTQPAKSKAATQLNDDLQKVVGELQAKLNIRDDNRQEAFQNTFGDSLIDATSDASFERGQRSLNTIAVQNDIINNGARAQAELSTDRSLKGILARSIFGNPYGDGVEDLRATQKNVVASAEDLSRVNDTFFTNSLKKDTPLAEIQASANADISAANASANALENRLLIAPTQSGLEAAALGVEAQGLNAQQAGAATQFQIATGAVNRGVETSRFNRTTQDNINRNFLAQTRQLASDNRTFIPTNPDGTLYDTTTYVPETDRLQFSNLGYQNKTAKGTFQARQARGDFNVGFAATQGQQQRTTAALSLKNTKINVNRNQQQQSLDQTLGTYNGQKQLQKQTAVERATKFNQAEAELRARMSGIGEDGVYSEKVAKIGAANYLKFQQKRNVELDIGYQVAKAEQDLLPVTINNTKLTAQQLETTLKARGKTLNQELANQATQIANTELKLDAEGTRLQIQKDNQATWTATQRNQYQIDFEKFGIELAALQDKKLQYDLRISNAMTASTNRIKAVEDNTFAANSTSAIQRLSTRKLTLENKFLQAKRMNDPVAQKAAYQAILNEAAAGRLEADKIRAEAELRASPEFKKLDGPNKIKQLQVLNQTYDKQISDLTFDATQKDSNQTAAIGTTANQIEANRMEARRLAEINKLESSKDFNKRTQADKDLKRAAINAKYKADLDELKKRTANQPKTDQLDTLTLDNNIKAQTIEKKRLAELSELRKDPAYAAGSEALRKKKEQVLNAKYDDELASLRNKAKNRPRTEAIEAQELTALEAKVSREVSLLSDSTYQASVRNNTVAAEVLRTKQIEARGKDIDSINKTRAEKDSLTAQVIANDLFNARNAATPEARQAALLGIENRIAEGKLSAIHLQAKLDLEQSPSYQSAKRETQIAEMKRLELSQTAEIAQLRSRIANQPLVDALTDGELLIKQQQLAEDQKSFNDIVALNNKRLLDKETVKLQRERIARATSGEAIEAQKPEIRLENYFKINGVRLDPNTEFSAEQQKILDTYTPGKPLGPDPIMSLDSLNKITDPAQRTEMFTQVSKELLAMGREAGFTKLGQNSSLVQTNIVTAMNAKGVKNLDDKGKRGSLLDIPVKAHVFDGLTASSKAVLASIPDWDTSSPEDNLSSMKKYFAEQGTTNLKVMSKQIADTMRDVMDTKARLGKFTQLGLPAYSELNYTLEVSKTLQSDDRFYESVPFITRPIEAVFGIGLKEFPGKAQVDILDQSQILKLLNSSII